MHYRTTVLIQLFYLERELPLHRKSCKVLYDRNGYTSKQNNLNNIHSLCRFIGQREKTSPYFKTMKKAYALLISSLLAVTTSSALAGSHDHSRPNTPPRGNIHQPNPGNRGNWGNPGGDRGRGHHIGGQQGSPWAQPGMNGPKRNQPGHVTPTPPGGPKRHDMNGPNKNRPTPPRWGHMH